MSVKYPDLTYPESLLNFIDGIEYPARKRDLLRFAREHDAPDDALAALERLPDESFDSWDEVAQGLGGASVSAE